MDKFDRQTALSIIAEDDLDFALSATSDAQNWFIDLMISGFSGYKSLSDEALKYELESRGLSILDNDEDEDFE